MNLAALRRAAVAGNLSVLVTRGAAPTHHRRRAQRFAAGVTRVVLELVVGAAVGLAFAAGVHAGARCAAASVPLVLLFALAAACTSSLRGITST